MEAIIRQNLMQGCLRLVENMKRGDKMKYEKERCELIECARAMEHYGLVMLSGECQSPNERWYIFSNSFGDGL